MKNGRIVFTHTRLREATALSIVRQPAVVPIPFLDDVFGTSSLSFRDRGACFALASFGLPTDELQRFIERWLHRNQA